MTAAIECTDLGKDFGTTRAVDRISFTVQAGSVTAFLGPNGAGKSTTIRLLLGMLRPTRGTGRLLGGEPLADPRLLGRVGYLPGDFRLEPTMTGTELFRWFGRLRGRYDAQRVDALIARLGVEADKPFGSLSKGNRQKIGIVQAFQHQPEVLLLDEPSSGLDPLVQHELLALVRESADDGAAVLFSSHVLPEIERAADRIVIIRSGQLVDDAPVDSLLDRARQRLELRWATEIDAATVRALPGVVEATVHGRIATIVVDGPVGPALRGAADAGTLQRVRPAGDDLEELFLSYYSAPKVEAAR
jgi:ABC-2 type transport system ATP-binding protein